MNSRFNVSLDEETKSELVELHKLYKKKLSMSKLSVASVIRLAIHKALTLEQSEV